MKKIVTELIAQGTNPLLARLYAARGVVSKSELRNYLSGIIPPEQLTNNSEMAKLLADAIHLDKKSWSLAIMMPMVQPLLQLR